MDYKVIVIPYLKYNNLNDIDDKKSYLSRILNV